MYVFVFKHATLSYLCGCGTMHQTMLFLLKINLFCRALKAGKSKIKVPAGSASGKGLRLSFHSRVLKLHHPEGTNSLSLHGKSEGREKGRVQP